MSAFRLIAPAEKKTFSVEWSSWLADGDTVASATWTISPSGQTATDLGESGTVSSVSVEDCTFREIYRLKGLMISTVGEKAEQTIEIRCH